MSVELANEVRELGMDGIALTPPYYYPDSQDELADHYRYAQDRIGLPLWVYNIPQTVKTAVEPGTVAMLAAEGTVVGVKDSSGGRGASGAAQRPVRSGRDIRCSGASAPCSGSQARDPSAFTA